MKNHNQTKLIMATLPLMKRGSLVLKTVSKPLSRKLGDYATTSDKFRHKYVLPPVDQIDTSLINSIVLSETKKT